MFELIRANRRRALVLMILMVALMVGLGYALGGAFLGSSVAGVGLALVAALFIGIGSWYGGDSMILQASGAHRIEHDDHPVLFNIVEEMTIAAGLPKAPEVYIIDADAPNAFATGRDPEHAKIAVTAGLLERLDRDELQGVIGHEMGHVANRDILYMTLATVMLGAIVMLADLGIYGVFLGGMGGRRRTSSDGGGQGQMILLVVALALMILAPIFARLLYFALSRRREYLADASSALYTRNPEGLARALEKISSSNVPLPRANRATAGLYIANPLKISKRGLADLTSTHPPISARVRILRSMAGEAGFAGYATAFHQVTGRTVGVKGLGIISPGQPASMAIPAHAEPSLVDHGERVRASTDALWRARGYRFISCPCGNTLKVPPDFPKDTVTCPNCGREHQVK